MSQPPLKARSNTYGGLAYQKRRQQRRVVEEGQLEIILEMFEGGNQRTTRQGSVSFSRSKVWLGGAKRIAVVPCGRNPRNCSNLGLPHPLIHWLSGTSVHLISSFASRLEIRGQRHECHLLSERVCKLRQRQAEVFKAHWSVVLTGNP